MRWLRRVRSAPRGQASPTEEPGERGNRLAEEVEQLRAEVARRAGAQEALTRAAAAWAATFDAIADFVSVHDAAFRVVRANRALADFLGLTPRDMVGRRCHELLHGTDAPWPRCPHGRALEACATVTAEVEDSHVGVPLLVTCSPFYDETGALVGTVHVARDVSADKRAAEERERLIAELQQALSTVHLLSGILPICSGCKKIRDDRGQWQPVEGYIRNHSEVEFSHGICPDCARRLYPEFDLSRQDP